MEENKQIQSDTIPELATEKNILGRWSGFFIVRYRIVFLIIAALIIWGANSYFKIPRELQPEVILPFGHVMTVYSGAAPDEVEKLITDKIEKKMTELNKVKKISSSSGFGFSSVFVEFESGVDIDDMVVKMREKVSAIRGELPKDAELPDVSTFETNNSPIMIINITGDYDFVTLKSIANKLKDSLETINDVSDVQIIGGLEREIKIIVDPQRLAHYAISLEQIKNAINLSNINFPGGSIVLDYKNYNIRTVGELVAVDELNDVVITYQGSNPVFLRDIAQVEDGFAEPDSFSRMSSGLDSSNPVTKNSVALSIKKKESADVIKTAQKIHEKINLEKGSTYPADLQVEISGDTAVYVKDQLGGVTDNAFSGLLLVGVILFLFIGLRESFVVAIVIPLSIFAAFGLMKSSGMTFNNITLFSLILAVGMLVDNGIVIMQNIARLRTMGLDAARAAAAATNQIAPAIASSTLTTLAAFFPIMLTPGIMGQFIKPIPQTVIYALSASFIVAITITPALCSMLLKKPKGNGIESSKFITPWMKYFISLIFVVCLTMLAFRTDQGGIFGFGIVSLIFAIIFGSGLVIKNYRQRHGKKGSFTLNKYGQFIERIIHSKKRRWAVLGITLTAFVLSVLLIPLGLLKVEMFPPSDFTRLYVNIETPKGSTLDTTSVIAEEVERRLFAFPEIKSFVSNVGITGADSLDDFSTGMGATPYKGRVVIDLYDEKDRERSSMEVAAIMRESLRDIPGAKISVSEVGGGPPTDAPIVVNIRGENLDELKKVANDFTTIIEKIEGTRDVKHSIQEGTPELQVKINKAKAASLGLDEMTIASGVRNAVHGLKATTFRKDQDEIEVYIRTTNDKLSSIQDLENLYFYTKIGQPIPFNQVAVLEESKSVTAISHEDSKRQVTVTGEIMTGIIAGDVTKKFLESTAAYPLPTGITITLGGEHQEIEESYSDMFTNMSIAAVLVFLILAVQFNSLSQPWIILLTVPMAMIGVLPGLMITGNNFGFASFVGVVALVGIAVNNAIVLVDYMNYMRKNGYEIKEAVSRAVGVRFVPIMATTITTAGGILPITLSEPFFGQLGYAIIFGLMASTLLTLVIIPVLYTMLEERKEKRLEKSRNQSIQGGGTSEKDITILSGN